MESTPYLLPNTQGRYVTVVENATTGRVERINDDGSRTIYARYFDEGGDSILEATENASGEFTSNLVQNNEGFKRTIGNSVIEATGTTPAQPTEPNSDQQGGSTPVTTPGETPTQTPESLMLYYPEDIMSSNQDIISFQAHKYQSGLANRIPSLTGEFELGAVEYIPVNQTVFLPIQSAITDQNSVSWQSDTINPIEIEAARMSRNLMDNPLSDWGSIAANTIGQALNQIKNDPRLQESIRTYIIGQAVGVNNLQSRLNGQVLNPNLELLFQGPQLRPFNFMFKMSARNKLEARSIKEIIKYFKKNMATIKGDDNIFLKAPNVFKIRYLYGPNREIHPAINLIKMCALTNCSVDYTPLGSYATYNDGTMVAYNVTLSFQELTPIYDKDYDTFNYGVGPSVSNHPIGA